MIWFTASYIAGNRSNAVHNTLEASIIKWMWEIGTCPSSSLSSSNSDMFLFWKNGFMLPKRQRYVLPRATQVTPNWNPSDIQVTPNITSDTHVVPKWRPTHTRVTSKWHPVESQVQKWWPCSSQLFCFRYISFHFVAEVFSVQFSNRAKQSSIYPKWRPCVVHISQVVPSCPHLWYNLDTICEWVSASVVQVQV